MNKKKLIKALPLVVILSVVLISAALLTYYGKIEQNVNVEQAVLLKDSGGDVVSEVLEDIENAYSGDTLCSNVYTIENIADTPRDVELISTYPEGEDASEVETSYWENLGYTFTDTQDVNDGSVGQLVTTVTEDEDWIVWTFDFPVEEFTGEGNLNVGLIIAIDGEGEGPVFQIHNNDGTDDSYDWGTWLVSPWGPTIDDGWMGWHSGDTNIQVTELNWVEVVGQRNTPWEGIVSGDGVMQIKIKKCLLRESFHWAASPTVGSGFYAPAYDVTMQIPTDFNWGTPIVTSTNYEYAKLMELFPQNPFELSLKESLDFVVVNEFNDLTDGFSGLITTEAIPA